MTTAIVKAARELHEHGLQVMPVRPDNKKPYGKFGHLFTDRQSPQQVEAAFKAQSNAMIAVITGTISGGLVMIDTDSPAAFDRFINLIGGFPQTVFDQTPRPGNHFYFHSDEPIKSVNGFLPQTDCKSEGGYSVFPPSINADGAAYSWGAGSSIFELPLAPLPAAAAAAVRSQERNNTNLNYSKNNLLRDFVDKSVDTVPEMFIEGRRDSDIFTCALAMAKGGMSPEEIYNALAIIGQNCKPPFPEKEIRAKIESAFKRLETRERTLSQDVKDYVLSTTGPYLSTDVHKALGIHTRQDQKNCSEILRRMCEEKIIERTGNKNGCFRLIENDCTEIDFLNCPTEVVDIRYPLGIDQQVKTMPKNIIVVAGEPNSGKTAFCLATAKMNMNRFPVHYFSSEMGPLELKSRLEKDDLQLEHWKVRFWERASNFADVIRPDAINIIDFLEMHDDFYRIGGLIKEIFDKLNKGIAIIALQKNPGTNYGLGGQRSLEKARLYLAMEPNKIKIVKCKNWQRADFNPNGQEIDFKLVNGCRFLNDGLWHKTEIAATARRNTKP